MEVNESVENTLGHSEQYGNAETSVELGEEPEEREENKTAAGINTKYMVIINIVRG